MQSYFPPNCMKIQYGMYIVYQLTKHADIRRKEMGYNKSRIIKYFYALIFTLCFFMSSGGNTHAATLFMGPAERYTNLQSAMAAMNAGDTLIIRDGIYTGASNVITRYECPPSSSTTWTTIRAENPGAVVIDGQGIREPFTGLPPSLINRHWVFDGIEFRNSSGVVVTLVRSSHVKFIRCGFVDAAEGENDALYVGACSYVLTEDCYSYGNARYHFNFLASQYCIARRCVTRHDRGTHSMQVGFQAYESSDVDFQNCIVIDSDQAAFYNGASQLYAFKIPQVSGGNINFRGCIALNNAMGFCGIQAGSASFDSCVGWDISGYGVYSRSSGTVGMNHMTLGNISTYGTTGDGAVKRVSNSIVCQNTPIGLHNGGGTTISDYNILYNDTNYSGVSAGANDTQLATAPSLKYLTGFGNGSVVGNAGATVLFKIGKSGTLWGEAGYNIPSTTESLWPFPNEDIVRAKMRAYTGGGVNGARGFCANGQTLTKYIWEYLGHTIPDEIYNGGLVDSTSPAAPAGVTAIIQ